MMNMEKEIEVLIPTYNRYSALAVTLASLYYQTESGFDVIISDQSPDPDYEENASIQTVLRMLASKGCNVRFLQNLPARGMAQQRQFLLDQSSAPYCLFLDDDLLLEPYVLKNLKRTLKEQDCGFAGAAVIGLSYINDVRPHQQQIEFWDGGVKPENIVPGGAEWNRYKLHNAANIFHVQQNYGADPFNPRPYKIAWVGGCVMYDAGKLRDVGGFEFWTRLPEKHCGEDVLAQLRVMKKYGGCAILPSGVYHQELETTVPDRKINAPEYLEI